MKRYSHFVMCFCNEMCYLITQDKHRDRHGSCKDPKPPLDPEMRKKRRWLICKTVLLVVLLVLCLILFVVTLVGRCPYRSD